MSTYRVVTYWCTYDDVARSDCVLEVDNVKQTISILRHQNLVHGRVFAASEIEQVQFGKNSGFLSLSLTSNTLGSTPQQCLMDIKPDGAARKIASFIKQWKTWCEGAVILCSKSDKELLLSRYRSSLRQIDAGSKQIGAGVATPNTASDDNKALPSHDRVSKDGDVTGIEIGTMSKKRRKLNEEQHPYDELLFDLDTFRDTLKIARNASSAQVAELESSRIEQARLKDELAALKEASAKVEEHSTLRDQYETLQQEHNQLEDEAKQQQADLTRLKEEFAVLQAKMGGLTIENAKLTAEMEVSQASRQALITQNEALSEEKSNLAVELFRSRKKTASTKKDKEALIGLAGLFISAIDTTKFLGQISGGKSVHSAARLSMCTP